VFRETAVSFAVKPSRVLFSRSLTLSPAKAFTSQPGIREEPVIRKKITMSRYQDTFSVFSGAGFSARPPPTKN
jgi:hypothetical protein